MSRVSGVVAVVAAVVALSGCSSAGSLVDGALADASQLAANQVADTTAAAVVSAANAELAGAPSDGSVALQALEAAAGLVGQNDVYSLTVTGGRKDPQVTVQVGVSGACAVATVGLGQDGRFDVTAPAGPCP